MKSFNLLAVPLIILFGIVVFVDISAPTEREEKIRKKKARLEHYHRMLQDPATGAIPELVRLRELAYRERMRERYGTLRTQNDLVHTWSELGPSNVGGRTRALALDRRNSNIVFAAGVSGGIWKSNDDGDTWRSVSPNGSNLSITSIAQDAVDADTWYASTGEVSNNTASGKNEEGSPFGGAGVYISANNGETWDILTYTESSPTQYTASSSPNLNIKNAQSTPFDYTTKVYTHDFSGNAAVFICSQNRGIWISTDQGQTFDKFAHQNLGELGNNLTDDPQYVDVVVDESNIITVFLGPRSAQSPYGFYRSYDLGETFFNVTPEDYLGTIDSRTLLAFAPSNNKLLYAFNHLGVDDHSLYAFDFTNYDDDTGDLLFSDLTANLPEFERSIFGGSEGFSTQEGYDMALAIHPTNPDIVVLGYVNLVRSIDGFKTSIIDDAAFSWIGGNDNPDLLDEGISFEEDFKHHADQHIVIFDPNNPDMIWSGHDGGISKTDDITANRVSWISKNNDYNVTQYFHVSISQGVDKFTIGGTQDNGTPSMDFSGFSGSLLPSLGDVSSGDGSYSYIAEDFFYASSQEGNVSVSNIEDFLDVTRPDFNKLFIHPFAIDPNDEGTIFFPEAFNGGLARNTQVDEAFSTLDQGQIDDGWEEIEFDQSFSISALRVTDMNPSHRLYIGGTESSGDPYLLIMENATTATASDIEAVQVGAPNGAWLNDIAINPSDGDEILLVYSNYNIAGLYHSTDGGQTFTVVEGNLGEGDDRDGVGETGPSLRSAEIINYPNGDTKYVVATSIGVFSTESLSGASTLWELEVDQLDNVVVEDLDVRIADGTIVAGTVGRGAFIGLAEQVTVDLPNLELTSFTITNQDGSTSITVGDQVFFNLSITNSGSMPTTSGFTISYTVSDDVFTSDFTETIAVGASIDEVVEGASPSAAGSITVIAKLDSEEIIAESNENDNSQTVTLTIQEIGSPDPLVVDFAVASSEVGVGESISFDPAVSGGVPPYTYAWLFEGGDPGASTEEQPTVAYGDAGEYDVVLEVTDAEGTIAAESKASFISVEEMVETGIVDEGTSQMISVYPNPVINNSFKIELQEGLRFESLNSLRLISLSGQSMNIIPRQEAGHLFISTRSIVPGAYVLLYELEGKFGSTRILIR